MSSLNTKKRTCSTSQKLSNHTSLRPRRATRPISDTASSWENCNEKQEESLPRLPKRTRAVTRERRALQVRRQIRLPPRSSQCRWALTGIWVVWTSHWIQICGCNWIRSRSVSSHHTARAWREEAANDGTANNHFHQDNYSFSTSPNMGATM